MKFIVTTTRKSGAEDMAIEISARSRAKFVRREDKSFAELRKIHGAKNILPVKKFSECRNFRERIIFPPEHGAFFLEEP